jgi:hypothetical protein
MNRVKRMLDQLPIGENLRTIFKTTGIGNSHRVIRTLDQLAERMRIALEK